MRGWREGEAYTWSITSVEEKVDLSVGAYELGAYRRRNMNVSNGTMPCDENSQISLPVEYL